MLNGIQISKTLPLQLVLVILLVLQTFVIVELIDCLLL